jgi:hypothetical protein
MKLYQITTFDYQECFKYTNGRSKLLENVHIVDNCWSDAHTNLFYGKTDFEKLKQADGKNLSSLDFIEEYSKSYAKKGDKITDFYKRQQKIQSEWILLNNLISSYKGESNVKLYETQSDIDKLRKLTFINMEVRTKNWLGLELNRKVTAAPTVVVNDIYAKIGAKDSMKQLELLASNYISEHPHTRYYAYEATTIALYIKMNERKRMTDTMSTVRVGN